MQQQGITDPTMLSNPRMIVPLQEIVYEIYFQVKNTIADDFLIWIDTLLIKEILSNEGFRAAKLYTLINDDCTSHSKKYTYYSVQFLVDSIDSLNNYLVLYGDKFRLDASARYGKQFTEERRILSYQKFYTYDSSFNPNTNTHRSGTINSILSASEPVASLQEAAPGMENKKGIIADIKSFFGFSGKREENMLVDKSNILILAPNPNLAKNVSETISAQSAAPKQSDPNLINTNKNITNNNSFSRNIVGRGVDNQNEDIGRNQNLKGRGVDNQNEDIGRNQNLKGRGLDNQNEDIGRNQNLKGRGLDNQNEESQLSNSKLQDKNIIANKPQNENVTSSNLSNQKANFGTYSDNPITDLNEGFNVNKDIAKFLKERDLGYDNEYIYSKDIIKSVHRGDKDFPGKDVDSDSEKYKDANKENIIVHQTTTKVKDINNDNHRYLSKDVYVSLIDKDNKLLNFEKETKKYITLESPLKTDITVSHNYEEKENDINLNNQKVKNKELFGSSSGKNEYPEKDKHKFTSEKQ